MLRTAGLSTSARRLSQLPCQLLSTKAASEGKNDNGFVRRRQGYRREMKKIRQEFAETIRIEQSENVRDELEDRRKRLEAKQERRMRRNIVSAGKQDLHLKQLADIKARKEERVAFNFELWTKKQEELAAKKQQSFTSVANASEDWVTDANLEEHIERAVDSFFIAGDAAERNSSGYMP